MWTRAPGGAAWMQKDAWIPSGFFLIAGVLDVELFRKGTARARLKLQKPLVLAEVLNQIGAFIKRPSVVIKL